MLPFVIVTPLLIITNIIFSYRGLKSASFFERYLFRVDNVLIGKQYDRMITSGFLHLSWPHLFLNMFSLYFFGTSLEGALGSVAFLVVYMAGLLGGNLLALLIHKQHGDYSAAGASGAICGIMFATIALFPGIDIGLLFLPIYIPGWLFGLLYSIYTIYGIRSKADNIGHEAHLGGALVGMFVALLFRPTSFTENYVTIAIISVPALLFIYIIITRPYVLFIDNFYFKQHRNATIEDRYNISKVSEQNEIDAILEKIHRKGINSLTAAQKKKLDNYSK